MARSSTRHAVICGTDFTDQAARAADVAAALAHALRRPLLLLHVRTEAGRRAQVHESAHGLATVARRLRREVARLAASGATVVPEMHRGRADEVLCTRASECAAELLVVGAVGTRALGRRILGSVAERVAEAASVPTLIVRDAEPFRRWLDAERALRVFVGFDFTVTAEAATEWVRRLIGAGLCDIVAGYAHSPAEARERFGLPESESDANGRQLRELLERDIHARVNALLDGRDVQVRVLPDWGGTHLALVGMAIDARADLLVVGTHQRAGIARWWSGSVSRGVLYEAPTNVAIVPAGGATSEMPRIPVLHRVLVATDLHPHHKDAIALACAMVRPGGVVRLVHVTHPRSIRGGAVDTALLRSGRHEEHVRELRERLARLRPAAARDLGVGTEAAVVECEDTTVGICQEAERFGADVVVMATKGGSPLNKAIVGSITEGVMVHSSRPVLVIAPRKN